MKIDNLWDKQVPLPDQREILKKDISEGKVPELPYFVVESEKNKQKISALLRDLDSNRMQTAILCADYGNGKTNMVKYIQLYFHNNPDLHTKVIYQSANVEQTDMFLILLRLIQFQCVDELVGIIKEIRSIGDVYLQFAHNFQDSFGGIRNYTEMLFDPNKTEEELRLMIYLGTGQLYTKNSFNKAGVQWFSNYDRRYILVLFLNILAYHHKYYIFAIDELENLASRSSKRYSYLLSSYRDMVDLFNKIHGHLLLVCTTIASSIEEANPPLYQRVQDNVILMKTIQNQEDILRLTVYLRDEILDTNQTNEELETISYRLKKTQNSENFLSNRMLIKKISAELKSETEQESLTELLKLYDGVDELYEESRRYLENEGALEQISSSFFDPLEYYLMNNGYLSALDDAKIKRQKYQAYIDGDSNRAFMFLFSNKDDIELRLSTMCDEYNVKKIFIFVADNVTNLSNSNFTNLKCEVVLVDFVPEELLILLDMYKSNWEQQDVVANIIHKYTNNLL